MKTERQVLFWLAALTVTAVLIAMLREVLLPFIVGMILAYALNPVAEALVRAGLPRTAASAAVVALIVLTFAMVAWFLVPPLVAQIQGLVETLPAGLERLRGAVEAIAKERLGDSFAQFKAGIDKSVAGLQIDWSAIVPAVLASLWARGLAVVNFVSLLLITPLVVFYLLVDWHPMLARIDEWLPRRRAGTVRRLAGEIDAAISAFIRGQGLVCLILATFYAIALSWVGLRYGLLIGVATGLLAFVPFAGWALGFIAATAMMLAQSWPDLVPVYTVAGIFVTGMVLDSALLAPRIVGQRVGLHPLWLILALFVFGYLMGFVGMLVAGPLAAAFAVLVRYGLVVYLGSEVYQSAQAAGEARSDAGVGGASQ